MSEERIVWIQSIEKRIGNNNATTTNERHTLCIGLFVFFSLYAGNTTVQYNEFAAVALIWVEYHFFYVEWWKNCDFWDFLDFLSKFEKNSIRFDSNGMNYLIAIRFIHRFNELNKLPLRFVSQVQSY